MSETVQLYMATDEMSSLAPMTRKRKRLILNALVRITGPKLRASSLSRIHAEQTVAYWRDRKVAESTINSYKIALRIFGAWMLEMRFNRTNPFSHLKMVKTTPDYAKRKPLTKEQAHKVIRAAEMFHPRDKALVLIALYTALRENEIVNLRWDDVDLDAGIIRAKRSKVHDVHVVPVAESLRGHLLAWRNTYEARCGAISGQEYVVPAIHPHNPIPGVPRPSSEMRMFPNRPQTNMRERIKKYFVMAGVKDLNGKGMHTLRRSAANMLLDSGADVRDVMHLLGHQSETMTARYLDRDSGREKLAERMKDFEI